MIYYDFLHLDNGDLLSDWQFSLKEEELLVGEHNGTFSLMVHQLNMSDLAEIQQSILYLNLCCDIDISRIVLIKDNLYYSIFERLVKKNFSVREGVVSTVQADLERLLQMAVDAGASDLHITRNDQLASVEFRVNGVLVPHSKILSSKCDELCFVLYNVQASTKETTWNRSV
ncbi:pilus assembly protein, partial [Salmonella enterica subsp. enterica serovar Agama]|nr:pilus assembly protein [Salmonella enterica subsp. enterica serovar Agama]